MLYMQISVSALSVPRIDICNTGMQCMVNKTDLIKSILQCCNRTENGLSSESLRRFQP